MDKPITIYGEKGFGSVPVEAALTLIGVPYQVVSPSKPFDVSDDAAIAAVNPQRQVPALVFPGGEVMTESAAILIWLDERYPEARLAPPPLDLDVTVVSRWAPRRKRFDAEAPGLARGVKRVDAEPRLAAFWAERFPFDEGWEG